MTPPRLGILMLDTRFPRHPGDVGNPASFGFPVRYASVPGATPAAIVSQDPRPWVAAFIAAGQELVAAGCTGLATTCGFLSLAREDIAAACGVPVAASALEQAGQIAAGLPRGRRVGILTISAADLSPAHLAAAGVPAETPVQGMDGSHFAQAILRNRDHLDLAQSEADLVAGAQALCRAHPDVGAIVLECTNMPPHAAAISRATGRPVWSILTYLDWFHAGLPAPAGL